MPVTAKLSRKFYEKFGDELTNELVEWFNMVDATYRSELRELNEINFARFDAKLEQRLAEVRSELLTALADLRSEMRAGFAELDAKLTKRMFFFWIGQAATTAGLVLAIVKLTS